MELWLREFDTGDASCAGSRIDPAAIRAAAEEAFPAMSCLQPVPAPTLYGTVQSLISSGFMRCLRGRSSG